MTPLKVLSNQEVAPALFRLHLGSESPLSFKAGQFVILHLPPDPNAAPGSKAPKGFYSIASKEHESEIELLVERREGYVSHWICSREPGDDISMEGPLGKFTLPEGLCDPLVFIGSGAGVAPLRSMILTLLGKNYGSSIELQLGESFLADEWSKLASAHPNFRHHIGPPRAVAAARYYVAGFNREVEAVLQALAAAGVESSKIHAEKFG
jgi:ferredoxin-NADP reductase